MQSPGPKSLWPSASGCQHSESSPPGRAIMEAGLFPFGKYYAIVSSVSRSGVTVWSQSLPMGMFLFFFYFCLSSILSFRLLHYISPLRVPSGHSNPIFILRTEDAEGASVHSPHSRWLNTRLWGNSPLIIAFLAWIMRQFLFEGEWVLILPSEIPKWPTESTSERVSCGMETSPSLTA